MDPVTRVRDYLRDHIGHLTRPGPASYNAVLSRWIVPIHCRTADGDVVLGDVEVDPEGRIVSAPNREALATRLAECQRAAAAEV